MRGCTAGRADSLVFERVSGASVTVDGSSSEHDKWLWVERMQLPTDVAVHACCAGSLDVTHSWESAKQGGDVSEKLRCALSLTLMEIGLGGCQ